MDASDLIRALPNSLRGAGRPHMDESGRLPDARLDKVRAEFSLTALAYNLRRALNILGMERLMEAVAT